MNIIEPVVQGYMFNEIINHTDDIPPKKGGLPVNKLIQSMEFITQKGGGAVRETPQIKQFDNYGIPVGLVFQGGMKDPTIQIAGEFNELKARVLPDEMFDSLVDLVSVTPKTATRKYKTSSNRKTIKH